jgi:quercetin dioxygenase-like cupin family protein
MAIPHAEPGDVIDVRPLGPELAGARSHALFKSDDLEVMRIVLRAGQEFPPHTVDGEITLQCLEGRVEFSCDAGLRELAAGELIHSTRNELHGLRAIEDSSLLLTIVLQRGAT